MVFCSNCGEKLPEDANFCTKCGFRTKLGVEAGVLPPTEDWREAFSKMGVEMEKAFQTAAKEIQKSPQNRKRRRQRIQKQTTNHLQELRRKKPSQRHFLHQMRRKTRVKGTSFLHKLTCVSTQGSTFYYRIYK